MNETIETLLKRRSIRKFKTTQISEENLKTLIDCGLHAATAMNRQPWHFSCIQNQEILNFISETVKKQRPDANEDYHLFYHAPTVIMISGKNDESFAEVDCANASMNICNAAYALGLGSCYIAAFRMALPLEEQKIKELCQVPENYTPMFCIAIGEADEQPECKERYYAVSFVRE